MNQIDTLMYPNNPSGFCYVKPEPAKIEYRDPPFTLDNRNRLLFQGSLFAWNETRYGDKVGLGNDAGFLLKIVNDAYKFGYEDGRK